MVDGYTYDVFGAIRSQSGSSPNYWLFTGEQRDADSEMYYLRARYYDPATGRFLSQDPLRSGNLYAYAGNNPVRYVDPYGLDLRDTIGAILEPVGDAGECMLNALDCVDPRQAADPLIGLLPEGPAFQIGDTHFSYRLIATCAQYPEACAAAARAAAKAQSVTFALYGDSPEGTSERPKEGDAFQHCFWSGLITLDVGAGRAEKVTTRYEAWGSGNDRFQRAYDIDNNERGREFAQYLRAASLFPGSRAAQEAALLGYCR